MVGLQTGDETRQTARRLRTAGMKWWGCGDEVAAVLRVALDADAVLIPFGGGTNISGSLEAPESETRTVISVDTGLMDRVLEIDEESRLARVQAGVLGPRLEAQLNARGWTVGHFADMTRAVRVVTPSGILATRPVPHTSTGPSVREMVLGSEGRLGIITEATVHVHRVPERRTILGYLFPSWPEALAAMREISESEASPSVTRVSDVAETRFSFATRKEPSLLDRLKSKVLQTYLERRRNFDL